MAHRLREAAQVRFADSFGELEITDRVRVFRKPSADFDAWIVKDFAADCVELVDVAHSARETQRILADVEEDRACWAERGIELNALSVDVTGTIKVGVGAEDLVEARERLPSRYLAPVVVHSQGPIAPGGLRPS